MVVTRHTTRPPSPAPNNSADPSQCTEDKAVRRVKRKLAIDAYDSLGGTVQEPAKKRQKSLGTYNYRGAVYNIDPDTPISWIEYNAVKKEEKKRLKARHAAGGSDEESWSGAEWTLRRDPTTRKQSSRADGVEMTPDRNSMPTDRPSHENPSPGAPNCRIRTSHDKHGDNEEPSSTLHTRCASTSSCLRAGGATTPPDAPCRAAVGREQMSARETEDAPKYSSTESLLWQVPSEHSSRSKPANLDEEMPEFTAINRPVFFGQAIITTSDEPADADVPGTRLNNTHVASVNSIGDESQVYAAHEDHAGLLGRNSGIHTLGLGESATCETIETAYLKPTSVTQKHEQLRCSDVAGPNPASETVSRSIGDQNTGPQVKESTLKEPHIDNSKLISFLRRINRREAVEMAVVNPVLVSRDAPHLITAEIGMSSSDVQDADNRDMTATTTTRSQSPVSVGPRRRIGFSSPRKYDKSLVADATSKDESELDPSTFRGMSLDASISINCHPAATSIKQNNVVREHSGLLRRLGHECLLGDAGGYNRGYIHDTGLLSQRTRSAIPFLQSESLDSAHASSRRSTANPVVIAPADAPSPRRSGRNGRDATQVSAEAYSSEGKAGRRPRQPDEERRKQRDLAIIRGWPIVRKLGIDDFASSPIDERK